MPELPVTGRLLVRGFRALGHLMVDRVGRVNLVVGRNNAGKSTLLEAIRLWASRGSPAVIREILALHDELRMLSRMPESHEDVFSGFLALFHDRNVRSPLDRHIHIETPLSPSNRLLIEPSYRRSDGEFYRLPLSNSEGVFADVTPGLHVSFGDRKQFLPIDVLRKFVVAPPDETAIPTLSVSPDGLFAARINWLWDAIALTELETEVTNALRIIAPEIERISLLADREGGDRIAVARVSTSTAPVPLRSLGDGVNRLLGIALSLANARNGIALLDEFENGIHYSVLPKVWDLIFATAQRLNVQVFATTHSWDCIDAFQQAAARDPYEEAALIRLDALHDGDVRATIFDERELSVVAREQIEVR